MHNTSPEGFRTESFAELAELEANSFWFISRNDLILWALERYCKGFSSFLEIGCGTGFVIAGIAKRFPGVELTGSELYSEGLDYAKARVPASKFVRLDARDLPYRAQFDVLGAFDVLEHIEEDEEVLSQAALALKENGHLILTVPQHKWLWSPTDEYACHVRRYTATELNDKIRKAGFEIIRSTSFVSGLLPAIMLSRFLQKGKTIDEIDPHGEFKIPSFVNKLFLLVLKLESSLIRLGINIPFGSSRLMIAKKV